jgi:serine/threonine protein phosphatase 1
MKGINQEEFLAVGGLATLHSYGIAPEKIGELTSLLPAAHLAFLNDLLPYWEEAEHIFVHAGLQPGVHLTHQSPDWLFWAREEFIRTAHDFGTIVVYGHTPFEKPQVDDNKIGIDTGAVYGNTLTCLVLPETHFISVQSGKQTGK